MMIKKLRNKFIFVNMMIVTIMLSLIFGFIYFSTSNDLKTESIATMKKIASNPMQLARPGVQNDDIHLPYFAIIVNSFGEAIEVSSNSFDLSDQNLLLNIIQDTASANSDTGILKSYNLRYLRSEYRFGFSFVFVDISSEKAILHNLSQAFLLIGGSAFLVFLGISYLLANWAIKPVAEAFSKQKQFVADASHELKTPLTVISSSVDLLASKQCSVDEQNQLVSNISTMSKQMRNLVEEMLELARMDNGQTEMNYANISLTEVANECALVFEPLFFEKELNFSYEVDEDIKLKGDPQKLAELINILLDNALKYASPMGDVKLALKHQGSHKCLLFVSNTGEAISEKELKSLFKRFYRVDRARTAKGSYGLGLAIADGIVAMHHGKISARSENGQNIFQVELPTMQ